MKSLPAHLVTNIHAIVTQYPTPFHIYDEAAIRETVRTITKAFSWVPTPEGNPGGYRNYFAVKALPNPHILALLKEEGLGADCSSLAELVLAQRAGYRGSDIVFTSNNTPIEEYQMAQQMGAIINLDDIGHIAYMANNMKMPSRLSFRYNPGPMRKGNPIIGKPEEAKFGLTKAQILEAYPQARARGATSFGLHTMLISNELNPRYFIETAEMLFNVAIEIWHKCAIKIGLINLGGGVGIPYRPNEERISWSELSKGIQQKYNKIISTTPLHPLPVVSEYGRCITGSSGYLICRVRHVKESYKRYIGVDANMSDLMRPAMYGAYHHITPIGKEGQPATECYDVTGSLCENNDKFAIDRRLPSLKAGDLLAIHDTGAHGHAMGFNYNGKLRHAELLLKPSGKVQQIRRAETLETYFSTLDF